MSNLDVLPPGVQARIRAGEVPAPRASHDPPDRIRDLRLAIAMAEDSGDQEAIARMNAQWVEALRSGATSDWQPPEPRAEDVAKQPRTRDELQRAAREADAAGDDQLAHALRVRAMHAPTADARSILDQANEADRDGHEEDAERLRIEALRELRGEPAPIPQEPERMPQTVEGLNAAIAEAEAAGDLDAGNRYRHGLLHLARQRQEGGSYDVAASSVTQAQQQQQQTWREDRLGTDDPEGDNE